MSCIGHVLLSECTLQTFCSSGTSNESSNGSSERTGAKRPRSENSDSGSTFPALTLSEDQKETVLASLSDSSCSEKIEGCRSVLEAALRQALLDFFAMDKKRSISSCGVGMNVKVQKSVPPALKMTGDAPSFVSRTRFHAILTFSSNARDLIPYIQVGELAVPVYYEETINPPMSCLVEKQAEEQPSGSSHSLPLLLVGAGGIGCEVLKVLILSGYRHIHIIDLDTIDGTNLNRQFLFSTADVGKSKSFTARESILRWWGWEEGVDATTLPVHSRLGAPPTLVAYHDDIKAPYFDRQFFGSFAAVLNALDNVSARQHVNRMCCHAGVPLIESGTMGYNGQVQPILPGYSECYDCRPKPSDKVTYAVCTIHSRPTKLVHCVHYAKEIYEVLFGDRQHEVREDQGLTPTASGTDGGGRGELGYLREWRSSWVKLNGGAEDHRNAALYLARCIFHDKISELLQMKSSWPTQPPVPLELAAIDGGKSVDVTAMEDSDVSKWSSILDFDESSPSVTSLVELFVASTTQCCARRGGGSPHSVPIGFSKEDDLTIAFIAATSNLRAHIFHIAKDSVEAIRTVAGNIVPAIVTTNAIAGAGVVGQLDVLLSVKKQQSSSTCSSTIQGNDGDLNTEWMSEAARVMQTMYIRKAPLVLRRTAPASPQFGVKLLNEVGAADESSDRSLKERRRESRSRGTRSFQEAYTVHTVGLSQPPLPSCLVCHPLRRLPRVLVTGVDFNTTTLQQFVEEVLSLAELEGGLGMEEPTVSLGSRILYEADSFEELGLHTLSQFATNGTFPSVEGLASLSVELQSWRPLVFVVDALNHDMEWEVELRHVDKGLSAAAPAALVRPRVSGISGAVAQEAAVQQWKASGADSSLKISGGAEEENEEEDTKAGASGDAFVIDDEDEVEEVL